MNIRVLALKRYSEYGSGREVKALKIGRLNPSQDGLKFSVFPEGGDHVAFEVPRSWVEVLRATVGDYIVWEQGFPTYTWKPRAFEALFQLVPEPDTLTPAEAGEE